MPDYVTPNLVNASRVLKLLASEPNLTALQISRALNVPRTTVIRIASSLVKEGLLESDERRTYTLGPALIYLGMRAMDGVDIAGLAKPLLKQLAGQTGETAHLAMLSDDKSLLMEVCQSPLPIRAGAPPGTLADLHCSATGKIFLAWNFTGQLEAFFDRIKPQRRTDRTIVTPEQMAKETALILKRRYAVDEEEFYDGIRCVAVPVFNSRGHVFIALGITGVTQRLTRARIPECVARLREVSSKLSDALGYRP